MSRNYIYKDLDIQQDYWGRKICNNIPIYWLLRQEEHVRFDVIYNMAQHVALEASIVLRE